MSESPVKELSLEMGEKHSHHPRRPMWTEGLHTMGRGLVPQRDCLRHCYHYPSELQPSAQYFTLWLGQTTTPLVSVWHSNPQQGIPSTCYCLPHDPRYDST